MKPTIQSVYISLCCCQLQTYLGIHSLIVFFHSFIHAFTARSIYYLWFIRVSPTEYITTHLVSPRLHNTAVLYFCFKWNYGIFLLTDEKFNVNVWRRDRSKMLKSFGRLLGVLATLCLFTCAAGVHIHGDPGTTLYVAEEPHKASSRLMVINRTPEDHAVRKKRDAPSLPPSTAAPALQKNISTWVMYYFLIKFNLSPYFVWLSLLLLPAATADSNPMKVWVAAQLYDTNVLCICYFLRVTIFITSDTT